MDIADYINGGFVGCGAGRSNSVLDLDYDSSYQDYTHAFNSMVTSLNEVVLAAKLALLGTNTLDDTPTDACISILQVETVLAQLYYSECEDARFELTKKSIIFWNSLQSSLSKLNGVNDFVFERYLSDGTTSTVNYQLDLTDYQTLTREMYDDYIFATGTWLNYSKKIFKVLTDTAFDYVEL